jgi:hypothetical protein
MLSGLTPCNCLAYVYVYTHMCVLTLYLWDVICDVGRVADPSHCSRLSSR